MGWFDWLRKAPGPVMEHPAFGRLRAFNRPASGAWLWETVDPVATTRGAIFVWLQADERAPGAHQRALLDRIIDRIDALTLAAAPVIGQRLAGWLERPFDPDPWKELDWEGAQLGANGAGPEEFVLFYSCESWPDAQIAVTFEGERPIHVQIDD